MVTFELRGDESLQCVVHGVEPVHKHPEIWEAAGLDHKAAEQRHASGYNAAQD